MRRNLAAARLAILNQIEYRINFAIDTFIQPLITTTIEVTLWMAIITGMGGGNLGGFPREYYLAYALWANFVGRVTTNWMYEFIMLNDIETGKVNAILVRPISFFEYYLSQFVGYKLVTALCSFVLPAGVCLALGAPMHLDRLPAMFAMLILFLVFAHTLSFCVATLAFRMNRASALTGMKNLALWVLAGELIPLDLYPEPLRTWLIHSPFAAGVYIPVGFVTGRFGYDLLLQGAVSVLLGLLFFGLLGRALWKSGVREYTGTGA